ncbi:cingulin isoform X2 [Hyperolius riggenbachi]|uniref:cingulin isoform X2 n=1 Tax=Hyperolius riggenbachi TaxID=752182 RepID=UPI0035A2CED4
MERRIHGEMADQHMPVGQGVQIRFIDDLKENRKATRNRRAKQDSYGVAIRVQGIDGQPFVVLNSGDQAKSSYGVQIKTDSNYGSISPNPPADHQGIASRASHTVRSSSSELELPENPYDNKGYRPSASQYSSTSDEELNSRPRAKPRALQPARKEELRRSQSHGSLNDPELDSYGYDGHYSERSSTLDTTYSQSSSSRGSLRKLDNGEPSSRTGFKPATSQQPTSFSSRSSLQRKGDLSPSSPPKMLSEDIDTKPLSSVDSLISKFDTKGQVRGRTARRSQASKEDKKRSQSLDGRKSNQDTGDSIDTRSTERNVQQDNRPFGKQSLQRVDINKNQLTTQWVAQTMEEPVTQRQQRSVQAEMQLKSTPDLLKDQQKDGDPNWEIVYNILRDGSGDNEVMLRKKTGLLLEKFQSLRASPGEDARTLLNQKKDLERKLSQLQQQLDDEIKQRLKQEINRDRPAAATHRLEIQLEENMEECKKLKEVLEKKKNELSSMNQELVEVRMSKEQAETKLRSLEMKLQDSKEELNKMRTQGVTSDKHALLKDQISLESERQKINLVVRNLQRELEESSDEINQWKEMFQKNKEEFRSAKQEVLQLKMEKEEFEDELKEMKDRYSLLQAELEQAKKGSVKVGDLEAAKKDLQRFEDQVRQLSQEKKKVEDLLLQRDRELSALKGALKDEVSSHDQETEKLRLDYNRELQETIRDYEERLKEIQRSQDQGRQLSQEKQRMEDMLHQRERELSALKGALKDEVSGHDRETEKLRDQFSRELQQTKRDYEEQLRTKKRLEEEKGEFDRIRQVLENSLQESRDENDDLRRKILGLEAQVKELRTFSDDLERAESRLKEKVSRLEADKKRMEESLGQVTDQEQEFSMARREMETRLDEAQRSLKRLTLEYDELQECYQEEIRQKDQLKKTKNELEEQKRLLDKSMDKLTRELDNMSSESRDSLQILQLQLEEYKEKSRREITESQKQSKEKTAEAERLQGTIIRLQEEVQRLKQALQDSQADRENAVLDKELVVQRLQALEQDVDSKKRSQDDRYRQVKVLEDKVKRLEAELDEEKNTVELMTDRVNRSRDQMDQLRAELMQERSSRQDLECDKVSLERQNKDMKSRLASMEGQQKPSANVSQLEARLLEVQEKLQFEERERNTLLSTNRKLERKIKELNIQLEDERLQVNDQKDQLNLRVKALKRQVDEAEEEIERMEGLRKKAAREVEEQMEINEQLQARLKAMEKENRNRKPTRPAADDDFSSDGEFDAPYDPSSITSLLTESNLQTSAC